MASDPLPDGLRPPGVVILAGPLGSGKTEIALNLAARWACEAPTYLADLDVVTPYYRSRDAKAFLLGAGVGLLSPEGEAGGYDAPVLPRELGWALHDPAGSLVLDVGGQPHGAGVLVHWREALRTRGARLCFVLNPRRPGAATADEAVLLAEAIVTAVGLPLHGLIANGNRGPETGAADLAAGVEQARDLRERLGVPVLAVGCTRDTAETCGKVAGDLPCLELTLHMRPPWAGGR